MELLTTFGFNVDRPLGASILNSTKKFQAIIVPITIEVQIFEINNKNVLKRIFPSCIKFSTYALTVQRKASRRMRRNLNEPQNMLAFNTNRCALPLFSSMPMPIFAIRQMIKVRPLKRHCGNGTHKSRPMCACQVK